MNQIQANGVEGLGEVNEHLETTLIEDTGLMEDIKTCSAHLSHVSLVDVFKMLLPSLLQLN